ncbi:cob(I)yrinic acid a,c-diamide adenosyltransferase [Candidatus Woesearchaeota archaeon]|nr:cob(I)yrinic acid a,c-diamide adenosyltransferase [Candidatus Woesearchaeota archaeon]
MKKGYLHVITGDGKGKTTASVGLAVRAVGFGMKVFYAQLFKEEASETKQLKKLGIKYMGYSAKHPYFKKYGDEELDASKGGCLAFVKDAFAEAERGQYDMLVIDELGPALSAGWISEEEASELIKNKPEKLELVLTGRGFPQDILKLGDYVSEIRNIKHPYEKGVGARKGIEE